MDYKDSRRSGGRGRSDNGGRFGNERRSGNGGRVGSDRRSSGGGRFGNGGRFNNGARKANPFVRGGWEEENEDARNFERGEDRRFERGGDRRSGRGERNFSRDERPRERRFDRSEDNRRPNRGFDREDRPRERWFDRNEDNRRPNRGFNRNEEPRRNREDNRRGHEDNRRGNIDRYRRTPSRRPARKAEQHYNDERHGENAQKREAGYIRLNRYIANAGICSRREADEMIANGVIKVNGVICTALGTLVGPNDKVQFGDQTLRAEKKVYLVMNKPKGYITTVDDPEERRTVMDLIEGACKERVYPVGRLDRNTTGVLLFTNDGDMAKKLTHPSHGARKIYHVTLDKAVEKKDMQLLTKGIKLEDGPIAVDEAEYVEGSAHKEVGIQIHSGRNRIVRRIFEYLGYEVIKLDRVLFAEITKKDMGRGEWRFLSEKEIGFLRMNTGEAATGAGSGSGSSAKKASKKSLAKFTEEQLEEAEAIAAADEAMEEVKPKAKRTTRKKAVVEEVMAQPEPVEEVKPKITRRKKAVVEEVAVEPEPVPEEKPKTKRTTKKAASKK